MPAFSISLRTVAARATAEMGGQGKFAPAPGGSDQGDVTVRLAVTKPWQRPRLQTRRPKPQAAGRGSRSKVRLVGSLGAGCAGGNPRAVRSLADDPRPIRAHPGRALGRSVCGGFLVRVSSGLKVSGHTGGRGLLGAGRVNMGLLRPQVSGGMRRRVGLIGAPAPRLRNVAEKPSRLRAGLIGRPAGKRAGGGLGQTARVRVGTAPLGRKLGAAERRAAALGGGKPAGKTTARGGGSRLLVGSLGRKPRGRRTHNII